jgi:small GTP-binding protein
MLATLGNEDSIVRVWNVRADVRPRIVRDATLRHKTAKIVLLGDPGVGKTGLGWRLAKGEFKEHASTHGQQFWIIDDLRMRLEDGTQCEAVLWDFAGQPDYRLVHALFLDNADLAILLFDPTDASDPLRGVDYWLKALSHRFGGSCRCILVGARIDRGDATLTKDELDAFCHDQGIAGGYVSTSALTGLGLDDLRSGW